MAGAALCRPYSSYFGSAGAVIGDVAVAPGALGCVMGSSVVGALVGGVVGMLDGAAEGAGVMAVSGVSEVAGGSLAPGSVPIAAEGGAMAEVSVDIPVAAEPVQSLLARAFGEALV